MTGKRIPDGTKREGGQSTGECSRGLHSKGNAVEKEERARKVKADMREKAYPSKPRVL